MYMEHILPIPYGVQFFQCEFKQETNGYYMQFRKIFIEVQLKHYFSMIFEV